MIKNCKQLIEVRSKALNGQTVNQIRRVIRFEQIGNFCPGFVRYDGKDYLVKSESGDLSDPFRRTQDYATSLYIEE